MGVNISDIVPREEIGFEKLRDKIVALDAFNVLYQFLASIRGADGTPLQDSQGRITSHLQGMFSRTLNLMGKGIKLVYVFDGVAPELKFKERERRKGLKMDAAEKFEEASDADDVELMSKFSSRMSRLTPEMVEEAKRLALAMGLPIIEAPSEADGQISYMCKKGEVDYAASMDYDCLLFGSPYLVRNLTLSQKRKVPGGKYVHTFLELVKLKDVLKELEVDQEGLISMGILVGTDFNVGGVHGIGPKKALKLVREKGLDSIKEVENWEEIYKIFTELPYTDQYVLEWGKLDETKVKNILVAEHEFSAERIDALLGKYKVEKDKNSQSALDSFF
jgi:flap endonuclease-1